MGSKHFENKARRLVVVHIEAWRRSGLSRAKYCRHHRLTAATFGRWLSYLAGEEAARKHAEYQAELRVSSAARLRKSAGRGAPAFVSA